jgi:hypothetical protein
MFLNLKLMPWLDDQVQLPPSRRIITSYNKAKVSLFSGYHHWFGHVPKSRDGAAREWSYEELYLHESER